MCQIFINNCYVISYSLDCLIFVVVKGIPRSCWECRIADKKISHLVRPVFILLKNFWSCQSLKPTKHAAFALIFTPITCHAIIKYNVYTHTSTSIVRHNFLNQQKHNKTILFCRIFINKQIRIDLELWVTVWIEFWNNRQANR